MKDMAIKLLFIVSILAVWINPALAQSVHFGINSGVSKQYGEYEEFFDYSRHISGNIHGYISQNLLIGLNISFVDLNLVEGNDIESLSYGSHWITSGEGKIFEIAPTLKIQTNALKNESVHFFGLVGLSINKIIYDVEYHDPWLEVDSDYYFGKERAYLQFNQYKVGLFSGLGFSINIYKNINIETSYKYRIIFLKETDINYLSLDIGIGMSI